MGLFQKIFGNKKPKQNTKAFKLVSSSNNSFSSWSGNVWE